MTTQLTSSVTCESAGDRLTFSCDPEAHVILVRDEAGTTRVAFGGFGDQPGAFDTPLHISLVQPEFYGEPPTTRRADAPYLAVADYGNARVQILDVCGTVVATLHDELEPIGRPTSLAWRAPFLEVEGIEGARTRIHLGAALLSHAASARATVRTCATPSRDDWNLCR